MTPEHAPSELPMNRRGLLAKGVAGTLTLAGLGLAGKVFAIEPTPGVTEGPYWVDELLVRSDVRKDPATGIVQPGLPMVLTINVALLVNGKTYAWPGAFVDIWQCNALGVYSDEAVQGTSGEKFLRGLQATDASGNARFVTVFPGWYSGRTPHIHFRVRVPNSRRTAIVYNFVSQLFFGDRITDLIYSTTHPYTQRPNRDTRNTTDGIFTGPSTDGEVASDTGAQLLLPLSRTSNILAGRYNVVIDLTDTGYNNATGGNGP
jgi:protocatechuate 3,4-dioxygenase beta subunit